jgi:hypothetical protein
MQLNLRARDEDRAGSLCWAAFTESLRDKSPYRTILALKFDAPGKPPDRSQALCRLKPSIPIVGEYGIPIRDEIELERRVQNE